MMDINVGTSSSSSLRALLLGASVVYVGTRLYDALATRYKLRHIPSVGPSGFFTSYLGAVQFFKNAPGVLQEGYAEYRGNAFKIPMMTKWVVVISGRDRLDELRKAPDEEISILDAVNEVLQVQHTLGYQIAHDPYHITTVRTLLTRNIAIRFQDVIDEIAVGFSESIPVTEEWSRITVLSSLTDITCRTSNRFFVGLPLCQDEDYRKLNIDFTMDVVKNGSILSLFPGFLRPFVARYMANISSSIEQGMKHLGPMIQERLDKDAKYGPKWEGRPNDLISWLLDTAEEHNKEIRDLALRVLTVNFAAIHTTSMTFTQILFDLAKHPEYIPELREEIEAVIQAEGLTKLSLLKLVKVDSFIKESQRIGGTMALSFQRVMLKDFTFSDGLTIPKGTFISVPNIEMQLDEDHYSDPHTFDGYRFLRMGEKTDQFNKHSMVALTTDYMVFGSGRHACPGRFFAVNEIKAFLVHILLNYDIMLDPDATPFKNLWFNSSALPDPAATLMIRKRSIRPS